MTKPHSPPAPIHPTYRPDIDGLRGIAVLSVVGFHMLPKVVDGGFVGVDIFFVMSGFLISLIILSNLERGSFSFLDFYRRRIRRIAPALITVMLACMGFGWVALVADEYAQLGKHVAGGGIISNILLWRETGYFDNSVDTKPLLHLWSLAIEEQFYMVWPLLLAGLWRWKKAILPVLVGMAILSCGYDVFLVERDPSAAFYAPQARIWELLIGALLAYLTLYKPQFLNRYPHAQSVVGAVLLVLAFSFINRSRAFPGLWALLPSFGAFCLIAAGPRAVLNRFVLSNKVLIWFGLISYPLYLWHWPLLVFQRIVLGEVAPRKERMAAVAVSIILAWLTMRLIEKPLRFGTQAKAKAALLLVILLAVLGTGYTIYKNDGFPARLQAKHYSFNEHVEKQFVGALWSYTANDICLKRFPFPESAQYSWWFCMLAKDAPPSVILLGNSYANQLYPGLAQHPALVQQNILSVGTCGPIHYDDTQLNHNKDNNPCSGELPRHQEIFIDKIITQETGLRYAILDGVLAKSDPVYIDHLIQRIAVLEKRGLKIILFVPHIEFAHNIRSCFSRPFQDAQNCTFGTDLRDTINADFKVTVDAVRRRHPNVLVFDQNALFCDAAACSMVKDGMPLFRDDVHISEYGSQQLADLFVAWAKQNAPDMLK